MGSILKVFLDALLGSLAKAFLDWRRDTDRMATHEALGRSQVQDAQKAEVIDAVKNRKQVEDDLARLSADERRRRLREWAAAAASH